MGIGSIWAKFCEILSGSVRFGMYELCLEMHVSSIVKNAKAMVHITLVIQVKKGCNNKITLLSGCIRNAVALRDPCALFRCARCLGAAIDEREVSEVEVGNEKLEVVPEFCYLGDMLSAGAGCDHTLQMCMGQVPPIASPSHQPPSAPSDQR